MSGNPAAEMKIMSIATPNSGCEAFIALWDHYEGVEIHLVDIIKANKSLHYNGEKNPHIWWGEFEKQLLYYHNMQIKKKATCECTFVNNDFD